MASPSEPSSSRVPNFEEGSKGLVFWQRRFIRGRNRDQTLSLIKPTEGSGLLSFVVEALSKLQIRPCLVNINGFWHTYPSLKQVESWILLLREGAKRLERDFLKWSVGIVSFCCGFVSLAYGSSRAPLPFYAPLPIDKQIRPRQQQNIEDGVSPLLQTTGDDALDSLLALLQKMSPGPKKRQTMEKEAWHPWTERETQTLENCVRKRMSLAETVKAVNAVSEHTRSLEGVRHKIGRLHKWTEADDELLIELHSKYGNKWVLLAIHFPYMTGNAIRCRWINLQKKLRKQEKEKLQALRQKYLDARCAAGGEDSGLIQVATQTS